MSLAASVFVIALIASLTAVAVAAEILARALGGLDVQLGWKVRACFTRAVALYFLIVLCWNGAGTLLMVWVFESRYPSLQDEVGPATYYLAAFASVFILEFVLANTNITVFGKGVFAFQQWMDLIRGPSITSVRRKHAHVTKDLQRQLENAIATIPESELQGYFLNCLGNTELSSLEEDAKQAGAQPKAYKIMQLVERHPAEALSLAKQARQRRDQRQEK